MSPATASASNSTAYRKARRALARQLHPDLGGDPDAFTAAMARLAAHQHATAPIVVIHRTVAGRWQTLRRALRRSGHRRYIDL